MLTSFEPETTNDLPLLFNKADAALSNVSFLIDAVPILAATILLYYSATNNPS